MHILIHEHTHAGKLSLRGALKPMGAHIRYQQDQTSLLCALSALRFDVVVIVVRIGFPCDIALIKAIRSAASVPVIVLSERIEPADIAQCMDAGADDCMSIPYEPSELRARITALCRRSAEVLFTGTCLLYRGLCADLRTQRITLGIEELRLTKTEYRLLVYMLFRIGCVATKEQLARFLPGAQHACDNGLHTHMRNIRRKLRAIVRIQVVPGKGFTLV